MMSPEICTVLPKPNLYTGTIPCKLVIRHGFNSKADPFLPLQSELEQRYGGSVVNNVSYDWWDPVVLNGLRTAVELAEAPDNHLPIVLIGHSMGGLVCRVANLALTQTIEVRKAVFVATLSSTKSELIEAKNLAQRLRPLKVCGLATLATPNSATMTLGQIAAIFGGLSAFARYAFPNKTASFGDLTTSGLFRRFQDFQSQTPTLSISGSSTSRFGTVFSGVGTVLSLAGHLAIPNDGVVEDCSVDLRQSILPNEVYRFGGAPYSHHRTYPNCDRVRHSDIYDDVAAREVLFDFIERVL